MNRASGGGTRHAAALGLSEHCDALVIIVSEERGTISVAQECELTTLESPEELKQRLATFWKKLDRRRRPEPAGWWRKPALQTAAMSVLLAVGLWLLLIHETRLVYRTFVAPVELRNMPKELTLADPVPSDLRVTLAGPEQTIRQLHSQNLAISLDLSRLEPGSNEITITQENLQVAGEIGTTERLHLYRAQPPTLHIRAERVRSVRVRRAADDRNAAGCVSAHRRAAGGEPRGAERHAPTAGARVDRADRPERGGGRQADDAEGPAAIAGRRPARPESGRGRQGPGHHRREGGAAAQGRVNGRVGARPCKREPLIRRPSRPACAAGLSRFVTSC
jgi:hypothetical protein